MVLKSYIYLLKLSTMFRNLKHKIAITAGKKLLNNTEELRLNTGKRIITIIAGAYLFQKGFSHVTTAPVLAIQELALGSLLLYSGASGINKLNQIKPKKVSEMRKNQIQGNDPDAVPQFV